jgi:hypothetical protein
MDWREWAIVEVVKIRKLGASWAFRRRLKMESKTLTLRG